MIGPLPATERGTVLAGVNAKPYGWPTASVAPRCGRHPRTTAGTRLEERPPGARSTNLRSPRFWGMAVQVAGRRWGIEESFAIAKSETGLDEHQVRLWKAWYRHAILSMLAAAFLAAMRARLPANPTGWQAA
jgi:hypothetical protein